MGVALLEFESGVCATIMHARFPGRRGPVRGGGHGRGGAAAPDGAEPVAQPRRNWEEQPIPPPAASAGSPSPAFLLEMRAFAKAVLEGAEPPVTGEYGREIVRALVACEELSASGREVRLD